jgi:exoribonuclease R
LVLAAAAGKPAPYAVAALGSLAAHCTQKEDEANKVERAVRKCIAAAVMSTRIGERFSGIITGRSDKGVWVRIDHPPVEGKLDGPVHDVDVGDRVSVRLTGTNPERGFIDFILI